MTEDEAFNLLEIRLRKQKEREMDYPKTIAEVYNLAANKEAIEQRRGSIEHEVKTANAKLSANDKQVAGQHYMKMDIEPWNVVDTWPIEQRIGFYRGNALKYIMRMGAKDKSINEIGKGIHYLEKLLEVLEEAAK
jgi:hypothetical protein